MWREPYSLTIQQGPSPGLFPTRKSLLFKLLRPVNQLFLVAEEQEDKHQWHLQEHQSLQSSKSMKVKWGAAHSSILNATADQILYVL
ncbi:hypothetical protein V6N13_047115 [Hibiscus sabdariffa]